VRKNHLSKKPKPCIGDTRAAQNMNFLKKLQKWGEITDYPADSEIFSEGEPAGLLFVIVSGDVELTMDGDLMSTETAGGIIGEMAIIEDAQQGATASTLTETRVVGLNREQINDFMLESSEFALHLMTVLASRLRLVHEYNTTDFTQIEG